MKLHGYHNLYIRYTSRDTLQVHFEHSKIVKEERRAWEYHNKKQGEYEVKEIVKHDLSKKGIFTFWITKTKQLIIVSGQNNSSINIFGKVFVISKANSLLTKNKKNETYIINCSYGCRHGSFCFL